MFSELNLRSTYSTYENDIGAEFYVPVLSKCTHYDRASAYFSAKALANYAKGLELFASNGHKFRLIVSSEIGEDDYNEIIHGYQLREKLKNDMLGRLNEQLSAEEEANISNLAYLISIGTIDIKMAFTKKGIFHDKFGIMKDFAGNIICFRGSNNETDAAFHANYEAFDITCSWLASAFDYSKITKSIESFNNLWENRANDVYVCDVDEVVYKRILEFSKGEIIFEPVLLKENCLILDHKNNYLELNIKIDPSIIWNNQIYKLRLKRYIDSELSKHGRIVFKKQLTYPIYKKIINILQVDAQKRGYAFYVTNRLHTYIKDRELNIKERANVGLAIKQQAPDICERFNKYKNIVDNEMVRKLREKQVWDSFYMCIMRKAANFSVPGSGKTSSVLGVYAYLNQQKLVDKIIMVGPKNSFGSWVDEFSLCFESRKHLKLFNVQEYKLLEQKKNALLYDTKDKNLLLFNYESLNSIMGEIKRIVDKRTLLVFDEVHKVKAIDGLRAEHALEISKLSYYTIAMTGTPIPNSYADIKNLLEILYHDEYDEYFGFSEEQLKNPTDVDIVEINNRIQPFFCRTTKGQLAVPNANDDIIITTVASEYENRIFHILLLKYAKNKLTLIIRLLQLESNPQMLLRSLEDNGEDYSDILDTYGDIDDIDFKDYSSEIVTLINSIEKTRKFNACIEQTLKLNFQNEPVIIWCIFIDSILKLSSELQSKGLRVGSIYGSIEPKERELILKLFKEKKLDVLITNPHTLAESVSLHSACHNAIYYEYSYNLVHLLQSKDRIHRLGLPDNQYTQYYYLQNEFLTRDNEVFSLDKKIYERLHEKERIMLQAIENNKLEQLNSVEEDIELIFKDLNV
ncbi:helicase domain protein [Alkaliphilus metalliredigens QYMF]|uniref:Helicase domain protein n=1 Tax=Alkaliphilus metalliredigens (strain QYMF) TaxID=293826 RepID=A6TQ37_ALKMQ|nr:SNF2-related protein [Alkaliphilus metalliredigens]ABR48305.1 helicase domain protein [Alkaliphilus metalliredigens QYMF]